MRTKIKSHWFDEEPDHGSEEWIQAGDAATIMVALESHASPTHGDLIETIQRAADEGKKLTLLLVFPTTAMWFKKGCTEGERLLRLAEGGEGVR